MQAKKQIIISNSQGLHARPASIFVQKANTFSSKIVVEKDSQRVDGKSIMGILMLEAGKGSRIILEAYGDDAEEALQALEFILMHETEEVNRGEKG
ncbi:MAG: HPr family phosphocarrier protein [Candidatus Omnitrophica bacterium]|nr:HPr family phosphocarrier protein [Candidatus Omnitrophota bacterium]